MAAFAYPERSPQAGARLRYSHAFTMLELLIVIGVLAIISSIAFVVINPVEQLRKARDSQRISDLASINRDLGYYQTENTTSSMGSSSVVLYLSR
jgi:prepilin-type N-terminal cleavage/methylation domain-containing protein